MSFTPVRRLSRPALIAVLAMTLATLAACSHDDDPASAPSSSTSPTDSASTAGTTKLQKSDARLEVTIEQMRGGVKKSRRAGLTRDIGRPIKAWMDAAYLDGEFPRDTDTKQAFPGWTGPAAALARRDAQVTTNAAMSKKIVGVVADQRSADLYVFAVGGLTGGATANVHLKMTAEKKDGHLTVYAVSGKLYLTRKADTWHIFGYDLHRTVVRA